MYFGWSCDVACHILCVPFVVFRVEERVCTYWVQSFLPHRCKYFEFYMRHAINCCLKIFEAAEQLSQRFLLFCDEGIDATRVQVHCCRFICSKKGRQNRITRATMARRTVASSSCCRNLRRASPPPGHTCAALKLETTYRPNA